MWFAVAALGVAVFVGYAFARILSTPFDNQDVGNWACTLGLAALLVEGYGRGRRLCRFFPSDRIPGTSRDRQPDQSRGGIRRMGSWLKAKPGRRCNPLTYCSGTNSERNPGCPVIVVISFVGRDSRTVRPIDRLSLGEKDTVKRNDRKIRTGESPGRSRRRGRMRNASPSGAVVLGLVSVGTGALALGAAMPAPASAAPSSALSPSGVTTAITSSPSSATFRIFNPPSQVGPAGSGEELTGVYAASPKDVWAVGGATGEPFEHWNGNSWTGQGLPAGRCHRCRELGAR